MTVQPPAVSAALSRFAALDLARLSARPVTARSYDTVYAAYMADLAARLNAEGIAYNVAGTASNTTNLVTDTYAITGRAFAYQVAGVEAARDDAICAVLLPWSYGLYLDGLGANQDPPVSRQPVVANPRPYVYGTDAAADWQSDDVYRSLIALAPEALSTCGPEGAYLWFALEVQGVASAACYGPMSFGGTRAAPFMPPGEVHIPILSSVDDGSASAALVQSVSSAVSDESRRPIADFVTVSAATVLPWQLGATLYVGPGIDRNAVGLTALARMRAVADFQHRPGGSVLAQDAYAALKVPDASGNPMVGLVDLGTFSDVNPGPVGPANPAPAYSAPYCRPGDGSINDAVSIVDVDGSTLVMWGDISLRVVQSDV